MNGLMKRKSQASYLQRVGGVGGWLTSLSISLAISCQQPARQIHCSPPVLAALQGRRDICGTQIMTDCVLSPLFSHRMVGGFCLAKLGSQLFGLIHTSDGHKVFTQFRKCKCYCLLTIPVCSVILYLQSYISNNDKLMIREWNLLLNMLTYGIYGKVNECKGVISGTRTSHQLTSSKFKRT